MSRCERRVVARHRAVFGQALCYIVPWYLHGRTMPGQVADSLAHQPTGRLLRVVDLTTGEPVAGVQVRDAFGGPSGGTSSASTTVLGTVRLSGLTTRGGAALVRLTKLGYAPATIVVTTGDTIPITVTLQRVSALAPVVTTESYRIARDRGLRDGIEQRCAIRTVTCFREADLAARPSANMADVLLRARGVTLGACGADASRSTRCGRVAMRSSVIPPAYCEPSIFVDGFLWNPRVAGPAIDERPHTPATAPFTPADVKSVEVYSTEVPRPLRFVGDPQCGAVVIWTR